MTDVLRPARIEDAVTAEGEYRAGGTDVHARARLTGDLPPAIVDLRDIAGLHGIRSTESGGTWIGAMERLSALVTHPDLAGYPALVATLGSLANPHIRQVATLGGNLLQHTRCAYYRHPDVECFKSGADHCPARDGEHSLGVVFDRGPCVYPHPSSVAMTLLVYEARVRVHGSEDRSMEELYGDGADGSRDHQLEVGAVLTGVELPEPVPGERGSYWRANGRLYAEWPLVEAVCRLQVQNGVVAGIWVAVGGVAPVPLRLRNVEAVLIGKAPDPLLIEEAAAASTDGATPLPQTGYKLGLLRGTVLHVLNEAIEGSDHSEASAHERGLGWK